MEVLGASGAPWGTTSVEVADASPRLGDSVLGLLQDLVVRDAGASIAGSAALGDAAPALESLSIVSLGVFGLCVLGSPGSSSPPIN
jgi:hypothetical protein